MIKRSTLAILGVLALMVGLVAGTTATATAADYPGTVKTTTTVSVPNTVARGAKAVVKVNVTTGGSSKVVGKVTMTVKGKGVNFSKTVNYSGSKVSIATPKLTKKGVYKVTVTFDAKAGSVFKDSKDTDSITVK